MTTFYEMELDQLIVRGLTQMGFEAATPIQEQIIPYALEGKDVIGQAQTGTGKTAAFGIPLLSSMDTSNKQVQGLVLAPTRELAIQVSEELNKIGRFMDIHALPIYGGQDIGRQIRDLKKKPQIIVATPGRFMDHMRRKTIRLDGIHSVVLDEADEMLSMGFIEDIELILKEIPLERQTLLFSATMPSRLKDISQKFMKDPVSIKVKAQEMTVPSIEQIYFELHEKQKFDVLCRLFDIHTPELAIIFGRTKRRVDELNEALKLRGYAVEGIHGDLKQGARDSAIGKFKRGAISILVATDVAARGLDISGVTHVFNFDLPQDPESYVHRIGRTGRAGKEGMALTFVTPGELEHLQTIERVTKRKMVKKAAPSTAEANQARYTLAIEKLKETMDKGQLKELQGLAESLLQEADPVTVVAAALKMSLKEQKDTPVKLTAEAPLRVKKKRTSSYGGRSDFRSGRGRNDRGRNDRGRDRGRNERGNRDGGRKEGGRKFEARDDRPNKSEFSQEKGRKQTNKVKLRKRSNKKD
ncbi:DEAD/DEAH box helicase [Bacillus horti]|uniref:ATP-dependent RNA helicase DeaD n=1 Tax=Caldalkalibacillus horti TaxID=77523 RepID=A0ABT9VVN1_9BACI|nr:DEAD/DEAH box helicase [Bacillus horti]MDQ0165026.1 ATP-dependent RNA helicase DeaD [Bacillus horti]